MDEIYRGYRIAISDKGKWIARITRARGHQEPLVAEATLAEGPDACAVRARLLIDRYVAFLADPDADEI